MHVAFSFPPSLQRYFGCAIGKGARVAKTDIERLEMTKKTCREAIQLVAKMYVVSCVSRAFVFLFLTPIFRGVPNYHWLIKEGEKIKSTLRDNSSRLPPFIFRFI